VDQPIWHYLTTKTFTSFTLYHGLIWKYRKSGFYKTVLRTLSLVLYICHVAVALALALKVEFFFLHDTKAIPWHFP